MRDAESQLQALVDLIERGCLSEAEEQSVRMLESAPQIGLLWKILSFARLKQGKDPLEALRRAAELLPQDAEVHANLGGVLRDRGEWESALASLRQALTLQPQNYEALIDAGDVQRALKRPREAVNLYYWALQIRPNSREAYHGLGNAFLEDGQIAEAVRCYKRTLELGPEDPRVLCNLGNALRQLSRFEEAAACSRAALQLAPDLAMAHNNLGLSYAGLARRAEAISSYREALKHQPRYVEALINLGNALAAEGGWSEALRSYQQAIELEPQNASSHCFLGHALLNLRRVDEAAASFGTALAVDPRAVSALLGLSAAQRLQRLPAAAEASCEAALAIEPQRPDVLALLGELRADQGRFEEAQGLFRRALRVDPLFVPAYTGIAAHQRMSRDDEEWLRGAMELQKRSLPLNEQIHLHYALGKYYDDIGEYEQAFPSFRAANELNRGLGPPYDAKRLTHLVDQVTALCSAEFVRQQRPGASMSDRPVFIIGMPRSGTSLLEQILASHPAVFGAGEVRFWDRRFADQQQQPANAVRIDAALTTWAGEYLQQLQTYANDERHITDKMPANFLYAGLIHAALPRARMIHMQRHPLDTCLSVYFQNFYGISPYANDLQDLTHYYQEYQRIMAHWRTAMPAGTLLEVSYEALVDDLEGWTRKVLEFIGLDWDVRCLSFHETRRSVITASKWQVRQQINRRSVGRWRHYERHLGPLQQLTSV